MCNTVFNPLQERSKRVSDRKEEGIQLHVGIASCKFFYKHARTGRTETLSQNYQSSHEVNYYRNWGRSINAYIQQYDMKLVRLRNCPKNENQRQKKEVP